VPINTMLDLLVSLLSDLYGAERKLLFAVPKMATASRNGALSDVLRSQLVDTRQRLMRLEACFRLLGVTVDTDSKTAMEGLLRDTTRNIRTVADPSVLDAAIIAGLQRCEHYEITAYGTAAALAKVLGQNEVANLLESSMEEEKVADRVLTALALGGVNDAAAINSGLPEIS